VELLNTRDYWIPGTDSSAFAVFRAFVKYEREVQSPFKKLLESNECPMPIQEESDHMETLATVVSWLENNEKIARHVHNEIKSLLYLAVRFLILVIVQLMIKSVMEHLVK
jgi:hypothetical protein